MKKSTFIIGLGIISNIYALDTAQIENEIATIQNLPQQERIEKMNELKIEISKLSETQREHIVREISQKHNLEIEHQQHLKNSIQHSKTNEHKEEEHKEYEDKMEHNLNDAIEHEHTEIEHENDDKEKDDNDDKHDDKKD